MTDVLAGEKLYLEPHQLGPDAVKELTKTLSVSFELSTPLPPLPSPQSLVPLHL